MPGPFAVVRIARCRVIGDADRVTRSCAEQGVIISTRVLAYMLARVLLGAFPHLEFQLVSTFILEALENHTRALCCSLTPSALVEFDFACREI